MKVIFDKNPTWGAILFLILCWVLILSVVILMPGCKARKVNKNSTEIVDKSNSQEKTIRSDSSGTKVTGKRTTEETKKDSSGYKKTTTTEYFEPNGAIPPGSPKKKIEIETGQSKSEGNKNQFKESFLGHSEISDRISEISKNADLKIDDYGKQVETKDNTLYWWIGAGIAAIMVIGFVVWIYRSK